MSQQQQQPATSPQPDNYYSSSSSLAASQTANAHHKQHLSIDQQEQSERSHINIVSTNQLSDYHNNRPKICNRKLEYMLVLVLVGLFIYAIVAYAGSTNHPLANTQNTHPNSSDASLIIEQSTTTSSSKQDRNIRQQDPTTNVKQFTYDKAVLARLFNTTPTTTTKPPQTVQHSNNSSEQSNQNTSNSPTTQIYNKPKETVTPNFSKRDKVVSFLKGLKFAPEYTGTWKIHNLSQLPFCIVVNSSLPNFDAIIQSIHSQNYTNYRIISQTPTSKPYESYRQLIQTKCQQNSVLLFVQNPINKDTLPKYNNYHQRYYVWVVYSFVEDQNDDYQLQVYSFYSRIYELLGNNDFEGRNMKLMEGDDWASAVSMGVMQLCQYHVKHVDGGSRKTSPLSINMNEWSASTIIDDRTPYTRLYKLSQDYPVDIRIQEDRLGELKKRKNQKFNKMTIQKIYKAIHLQQVLYLPANHILNALQYTQLSEAYNIHKYKSEQLPMCITVMSYNNNENKRNIKALQSILQQEYDNYHIVFVDDDSNDYNSQISIQYLQDRGYDMSKATFVQNARRNYVTYNIVNGAFNYCGAGQIQVLLDGDDEYIGRYVLLLLNAIYQQFQQKWVVYTNSKSNLNTYGTSQFIKNMNQLVLGSKRRSNHFIGPVRSWRVQLLYNIPLSFHLNADGSWLDTVSDDALQHSIVELAGVERTLYIPQIMYEYNKQYGNNDDSSSEKLRHRKQTYEWVLKMSPLARLEDITYSTKDAGVKKVLDQDLDVGYFVRDL